MKKVSNESSQVKPLSSSRFLNIYIQEGTMHWMSKLAYQMKRICGNQLINSTLIWWQLSSVIR